MKKTEMMNTKKCLTCQRSFTRRAHSQNPHWYISSGEWNRQKYCSHQCRGKSLEFRKKMSVVVKALTENPAWREKNSASKKGKPLSPSARDNVAAANRRKAGDPEWRKKNAEVHRGRRHSLETRAKMAMHGKPVSPETRTKIIATWHRRLQTPELFEHAKAQGRRARLAARTSSTSKLEISVHGILDVTGNTGTIYQVKKNVMQDEMHGCWN